MFTQNNSYLTSYNFYMTFQNATILTEIYMTEITQSELVAPKDFIIVQLDWIRLP